MSWPKILLLFLIAFIIFSFYIFNGEEYLSLDYLKENARLIENYKDRYPVRVATIFFIIYTISTAISFPGAAILTLAAGSIFGFWMGIFLVSFASTLGATGAFLASRYLFRRWIQRNYSEKIKIINLGIKKEGAFYLFALRLIPIFPFFLINLVMGLTSITTKTYFFVSQIGMLAGTMVYVNAGHELQKINSIQDILSFRILLSFSLLGILPLMGRKILQYIRSRRLYKNFKRPSSFDYNMAVIGGGAAGLVTAYICALIKAKVVLIEKDKMGGDCLNTGCIPSKSLIKAAKLVYQGKKTASLYGIHMDISLDFKSIMNRIRHVVADIAPHDSHERYEKLGVHCLKGEARLISPWEIEVNGKRITAANITVASGASPFIPPIKNIEHIDYLTSDTFWNLESLPQKFLVLGGGPVGLEMAQALSRLGSQVSIVELGTRIMPKEDEDVSQCLAEKLKKEGISILTSHRAEEFKGNCLICDVKGKKINIDFDKVLIAVGRKSNTGKLGLDISLRDNGTISANSFLQTNYPNIYVCGDVTGPFQLTHMASHQAWYCAINALFKPFARFSINYKTTPWCTYTDPEIATVGLNEQMAKKKGISYEVTRYDIKDLDRAIADGENYGFVKVLTVPKKDKILGATVVGSCAGETITEFASAMKNNYGLNKILGTIHIYPSFSEANKHVAGIWKRNHISEKLLGHMKKFHEWRRS